ncbi:phosphocholine-specific phospholipase C [Stenotrophobium rhamnosiphilum]|uniref:phospholipase C n=1 Tax=Stenotrophobium rhamnosiphilum TaxID=2029166 RepID=A0A2T5MID6_9GAMM|nr:phospholipase C, phosphocholine-specific [Stenotrophobium rhamnosiphilum]PTU32320.1 phospholipase C, phosphocholine-specific [Stenotrophobium rhamnosiphilum]
MVSSSRRNFLRLAGTTFAASMIPESIREALAMPAASVTGTINDVQHVVILMQENRSFDHYFGTLHGVRGFGDRFTVPLPDGRTIWQQKDLFTEIQPYHLDSRIGNAQSVESTPHTWPDAHAAWNHGRYGQWPLFKKRQSMGYYKEAELPFHFALANAFTLCDSYHCSVQGSTNPNRLFLFTGTNNPSGIGGGPAISNNYDKLGPSDQGYDWTTYPERLEAAGVSWKIYQDMADNYDNNSLAGFRNFREAYETDANSTLVSKGLTSTLKNNTLDGLKVDVLSGTLPQVSWVIAPSAYSEHADRSSPVQGAWYTQQVLEALTSNPASWSKTVLLLMYDENDGFFDHAPPPCAPSVNLDGSRAGASTVDDSSERYRDQKIYGPGPRVPMTIVSPWSKGGWVNSQVFDHSSVIRFLETRFGVHEPNISAWRRAVCGDLTSAFNFATPNEDKFPALPSFSKAEADSLSRTQERLDAVPVPTGNNSTAPRQRQGVRPSRALPYELSVNSSINALAGKVQLQFINTGSVGAVFQVYDKLHLERIPKRYTVEAGKMLNDSWSAVLDLGHYDLWVLGPNGFHRHFQGTLNALSLLNGPAPEIRVGYDGDNSAIYAELRNSGKAPCTFIIKANAYSKEGPWRYTVKPGETVKPHWSLNSSGRWYDFSVMVDGDNSYARRFAGRVENGRPGISDPAIGG